MKRHINEVGIPLSVLLLTAAVLLVGAGCASYPVAPEPSGFLSHYYESDKVDDTTWRYLDSDLLSSYSKFQITAAKCLITEFDGEPLPPESQQKVANYLRQAIIKALSDRYTIVDVGGGDVGEIRVAITDAYKTGNRLGLSVEGEIINLYSTYQAVAVRRTELSKPYIGAVWDGPAAKEIIDAWADRLREAIDTAHSR